MTNRLLLLLITTLLFNPFTSHAAGQPLLMKGKKTLYQRVLAKPVSWLYSAHTEAGDKNEAAAFSIHYVYERKNIDGTEWLKLGSNSDGNISGWGLATSFLPWNHGLTVSFHDPDAHDRVLLFRNQHSLNDLISQESNSLYSSFYKDAVDGKVNPQSPVISIQPKHNIDIGNNFYLMPILGHKDTFMGAEKATLLKVAIVPGESETSKPETAKKQTQIQTNSQSTNQAVANTLAPGKFRAGIAFVIDSTTSMGPYIARTRQAVRKIYENLNYADIKGGIDFAAVAFRDSLEPVEGLEYLTRIYANFEPGKSAKEYYTEVEGIIPASVSSKDFVEDSYAGVVKSIEALNWDGITARYVVLLTDAGARKANDPLSKTGLSATKLQQMAHKKNINIIMLHLLTPEGEKNHQEAMDQYRVLSTYPGIGDFYYGVDAGDIDAYGRVIDTLAEQITGQVNLASTSTVKTTPTPVTPPAIVKAETPEETKKLVSFQEKLQKLGNAIKMQYLQQSSSGNVPSLVESWLVDRDFNNPETSTLDVRVLLTRDQLSDLYDVMEQLLATFEQGLLTPESFLGQIKTLAAKMSRDPATIKDASKTAGEQLDEMGFMREYIDDLPYQSEIMRLSLEDWESWPAKQQLQLVHRLEEKIAWYKTLHNNAEIWYTPGGGVVSGNSVYPININMLP